jgi:hypothetical protein
MCLMLYLATHGDQPLQETPELIVEDWGRRRSGHRQTWGVRRVGGLTREERNNELWKRLGVECCRRRPKRDFAVVL